MRLALLWFFLGSSVALPFETAETDSTLSELLTLREYRLYQAKSRYKDRIDLFRKVFERQVRAARNYLSQKRLGEMIETVQDMRATARYAMQEPSRFQAKTKHLRSKQVKKLEIRLRKILETLDDLRFLVTFEYRAEFDRTKEAMSELRDQLLIQLLGDALGQTEPRGFIRAAHFLLTSGPHGYRPQLPADDRFTDAEDAKLRRNQELFKRVEVFLEIAESRLQEFARRMNLSGTEPRNESKRDEAESPPESDQPAKAPEEENPLFFFDYWELARGYARAIDGIMTNIDDQMEHRHPSKEEVKKSLKKLQEKVTEFVSRLAPIKELAQSRRDKILYDEILEAEETSAIALEGSQYGLQKLK